MDSCSCAQWLRGVIAAVGGTQPKAFVPMGVAHWLHWAVPCDTLISSLALLCVSPLHDQSAWPEREREKQRERERDRETERQRDRQRDVETERQTERRRDRQRDIETDRETDREREREREREKSSTRAASPTLSTPWTRFSLPSPNRKVSRPLRTSRLLSSSP